MHVHACSPISARHTRATDIYHPHIGHTNTGTHTNTAMMWHNMAPTCCSNHIRKIVCVSVITAPGKRDGVAETESGGADTR